MKADKCNSTADEIECVPYAGCRQKMAYKDVVLLTNQKRFE